MINAYGFDKTYHDRAMRFFDFMANYYWRIEVEGIENIPEKGSAMVVMNHAGTIALDVLMIKQIIFRKTQNQRIAWALMADFLTWTPFVGDFYWRTANILASWENAERLLKRDEIIVVCPEGTRGVGKLVTERYNLKELDKCGFARLAIHTESPIIPTTVIGSEEIYPIIWKNEKLGKFFGFPFMPVTFTFPLLGLLGAIPFPSKWIVKFDEPIYPSDYIKGTSLIEKNARQQQMKFVEMLYSCDDKKKVPFESTSEERELVHDVFMKIRKTIPQLHKKRKCWFF